MVAARGLAAVAVVAAAGLTAAGCSTGSSVVVSAPSGATGGAQPEPQLAPEVGECRGPVDIAIIDAAADPRPTTSCEAPHGSETFWVSEMDPRIEAWPGGSDEAGQLLDQQVTEECRGRHEQYLGLDPAASPNPPPDRLQIFAFFIPTEADFDAGARWFRCDAVVEPLTAAESTSIEGTLDGVYTRPLPAAYRLCEARLGTPVSCDEDHEIEYLASVALDQLTSFPLQRGDLEVTAACRTPLLEALGLTEERADLTFGYVLPNREDWDRGAKGAICVAGAADGSELTGTLAGLGSSSQLPRAEG